MKKSGQFYIGMTETEFKRRLSTHKHSFNHENDRNATALSQHIWEIGENNNPQNIKWDILKKSHSRKAGSKFCMLCLEEKLFLLKNNKNPASLNKKSEIFRRCFHRSKWTLYICHQNQVKENHSSLAKGRHFTSLLKTDNGEILMLFCLSIF